MDGRKPTVLDEWYTDERITGIAVLHEECGKTGMEE